MWKSISITDESFVSMKHGVEFPNILDQYSNEQDVVINYQFVDYCPRAGDRIAIFKLGWNSVKDYVVFEWVPLGVDVNGVHQVVFKKENLPKNTTDLYQACYIITENELNGASSPFQIGQQTISVISSTSDMSKSSVLKPSLTKNDELHQLKEENKVLKETLKLLVAQNKNGEDFRNFRTMVEKLTDVIKNQQEEITELKEKIIEGGEKYKKLYLEKAKLEGKKVKQESKIINTPANLDFTIGDFKSIPPFPLT